MMIAITFAAGCTSSQREFRAVSFGPHEPDALAAAVEAAFTASIDHDCPRGFAWYLGVSASSRTIVAYTRDQCADSGLEEQLLVLRSGDVKSRVDETEAPVLLGCSAVNWRLFDRPADPALDRWVSRLQQELDCSVRSHQLWRPGATLFDIDADSLETRAVGVTGADPVTEQAMRRRIDSLLSGLDHAWSRYATDS